MTNSRETTQAIMDAVYNEHPQYWPHGLDINQFDPSRGEGVFLVRSKSASMQPIGFVGWQIRKEAGQRIGYYSVGILPEHRGQGYAKEAVAKLINIKSASVDKVIALIEENNAPSKALAHSLGVTVKSASENEDVAHMLVKQAMLAASDRDAVQQFVELADRMKTDKDFATGNDPRMLQSILQDYATRGSRALQSKLLGKDALSWTKLYRDNPINRRFGYTLPWNDQSAQHYTEFLKGPASAYAQLLTERARPWNMNDVYRDNVDGTPTYYRQAIQNHPYFSDLKDQVPYPIKDIEGTTQDTTIDGESFVDPASTLPGDFGFKGIKYSPVERDMVLEARRRYYAATTPEEKSKWEVSHYIPEFKDNRFTGNYVGQRGAPLIPDNVLIDLPKSSREQILAGLQAKSNNPLAYIDPDSLRSSTLHAMVGLANQMKLTNKPITSPEALAALPQEQQTKLIGQNLLDYAKENDPDLYKKLRITSWISGNEVRNSVQNYAGPLKPILTADKIAKGLLLASLVGGAGYLGYNAWKKRHDQRKKLDRILRAAEGETKEASSVSPAARLLKLRERKSRRLSPAMRALLYGAGGAAVGGLAGRAAFTDPRSSLLTGALTGLGGAAYGYYDGLADKEFETAADYLAKYASKPTVANVYRKRQLSTISKLLSQ